MSSSASKRQVHVEGSAPSPPPSTGCSSVQHRLRFDKFLPVFPASIGRDLRQAEPASLTHNELVRPGSPSTASPITVSGSFTASSIDTGHRRYLHLCLSRQSANVLLPRRSLANAPSPDGTTIPTLPTSTTPGRAARRFWQKYLRLSTLGSHSGHKYPRSSRVPGEKRRHFNRYLAMEVISVPRYQAAPPLPPKPRFVSPKLPRRRQRLEGPTCRSNESKRQIHGRQVNPGDKANFPALHQSADSDSPDLWLPESLRK